MQRLTMAIGSAIGAARDAGLAIERHLSARRVLSNLLWLLGAAVSGSVVVAQGPQGDELPTPDDYPAVGPACLVTDRLIVKVTPSWVDFSAGTMQSELLIHSVCGGEITSHYSGVRQNVEGVFDDYFAAAEALQGLEICCDSMVSDDASTRGSQSSGRR